jgi:hypothetical protein
MVGAKNGRLKYLGVIGLIVCASLAGYLRQRPALPQSGASIPIDGGYLEPAAMVDASSPEVEKQTVAMDQRPVRPLFFQAAAIALVVFPGKVSRVIVA